MDEESGKVIDGTARARHWRRSQPKSTAQADSAENHFEAPKSIAASLLVPPAMLDGEQPPPLAYEPANGNGGGSSPPLDRTSPAAGHRNLFLSPDAAVPAPPSRRSTRVSTAGLRLVHRASAARRRISDIRLPRPQFSLPRTRTAAVL